VYGDPLADQAAGPPLNMLEMANPHKPAVVVAVRQADYADLFEEVWGAGSLRHVEMAYDQIALSIAAFERTSLFATFDSKYDAYLKACLDLGGEHAACADGTDPVAATARVGILDDQEWHGLELFVGENDNDGDLEPGEGGFCSACHVTDWVDPAEYDEYGLDVIVPDWGDGLIPPLFTDYSYDNLGAPKNWDNPFLNLPPEHNPDGEDFVDLGLGGVLDDPEEYGKFKVMTLRNIGISAPYLHNGLFSDLQEVVHFYNTRDDGSWPEPEFAETVNHDELGNLGLTTEDEAAITAFMLTLTDGYTP
jgi:cytochrome c peroxidase